MEDDFSSESLFSYWDNFFRFSLQPLGEARTDRVCLSSSGSWRIVGWYKRYSKDSYLNRQYSNCTCYVELCVTYSIMYFTTSEFVMTSNSMMHDDAFKMVVVFRYFFSFLSFKRSSHGCREKTEVCPVWWQQCQQGSSHRSDSRIPHNFDLFFCHISIYSFIEWGIQTIGVRTCGVLYSRI